VSSFGAERTSRQARAETARREREVAVGIEPPAGPVPDTDDTLQLYFLCAHPSLSPSSAVALTLRVVGSLTTRQHTSYPR
jgi:predicted RNA polymerase sigma factor